MRTEMGDSDGFVVENSGSPHNTPAASTGNNPDGFSRGSTNAIWPNVKPFFQGFLAGQITCLQIIALNWGEKKMWECCLEIIPNDLPAAQMKAACTTFEKRIPAHLLFQATYKTATFGLFDHLTGKVKAANRGTPLSLYQEACCGLISGGIASFISYPLIVAHDSIRVGSPESVEPKLNLRSVLFAQYLRAKKEGLFALWKGSNYYVTRLMFFNMGLLPSYHRSYSYFKESLDRPEAILAAGTFSSFIGVACCSSWSYMYARFMMDESGKKYSHRDFVFLVSQVLRPGGKFKFYSGILQDFCRYTPVTLMTWLNWEDVRRFEEQ